MNIPFLNQGNRGSYQRIFGEIFFDRLPKNFVLEQNLPPAIQRVCSATVRVGGRNAQGHTISGMGISLGKIVLTALHVIRDVEDFHLIRGEQNIGVREIARDENFDLVLLESEETLLSADSLLSEETGLGYGELYAVGYLWVKEAGEKKFIYKERLCGCKIKDIRIGDRVNGGRFAAVIPRAICDFLPGFSGGVLVDACGAIRGITQGVAKERRWHFGMVSITRKAYLWGVRSQVMRDFFEQYRNDRI